MSRASQVAVVETFATGYSSCFRSQLHLQPFLGAWHLPNAPCLPHLILIATSPYVADTSRSSSIWRLQSVESARLAASLARAPAMLAESSGSVPGSGPGSSTGTALCVRWHGDGAYAIAVAQDSEHAADVCVWYTADVSAATKIRGVWHACVLRESIDRGCGTAGDLKSAHERAAASWPRVEAALQTSGWDLKTVYLDGDGGCLTRAGMRSSDS